MNTREKRSRLVRKIKRIIEYGFELSPSECHFISSSFSVSTAEELELLFKEDDSDADVIAELVIAPDETIQENLELDLCNACFSEADTAEIIMEICSLGADSGIRYPENSGTVTITPDPLLLERFVHKLRLSNNPAKDLFNVSEELPEKLRLKMLVRLRNSTIRYDSTTVSFLTRFIREKTFQELQFNDLFDFTVSLLEEKADKEDLLDFFVTKKRFYEKTLGTIKQVNRQLRKSAVETMMLQGTRIPPASEAEVRSKVEMVERILVALFGYLDLPKEKPSEIDLGTVSGKDGLKKTIRLLS